MATQITALTEDTAPSVSDLVYGVKNPAGTPLDRKVTYGNIAAAGDVSAVISVVANASGQTGITPSTWTKMTQFNTDVYSNGATANQANDKIVLDSTGFYRCEFVFSFSGTASDTFNFRFKWNAVSDTNARTTRKLGTSGDVGSASLVSIIDATAAGQDLEVEFQIDATGDLLVVDGFMMAKKIANT